MQSIADATDSLPESLIRAKVWAVRRTQSYPKVLGFKPYDLAMCALIDSYYPDKINYYTLNLDDHEHNFQLAVDMMREVGIQVVITNPDEITEPALLKQLGLCQSVFEPKDYKDNGGDIKTNVVGNTENTQEEFERQIKRDKKAFEAKKNAI